MKKPKKENRKSDFMVLIVVVIGIVISLLIFGPYLFPEKDENPVEETTETNQQESFVEVTTMIYPKEETKVAEDEKETLYVFTSNEVNEPETEITENTENGNESEPKVTSYSEFQDFCRLTYAESGLESIEGQIAVAAVILNRQESSKFPDTFARVMNQSGAFSSVRNGEIYIMTSNPYVISYENIPDKTIEATQRALNGEDPTEALLWDEAVRLGLNPEEYAAGGALFFYNPNACSDTAIAERANIQCKVQIGNHIFYKVWG